MMRSTGIEKSSRFRRVVVGATFFDVFVARLDVFLGVLPLRFAGLARPLRLAVFVALPVRPVVEPRLFFVFLATQP